MLLEKWFIFFWFKAPNLWSSRLDHRSQITNIGQQMKVASKPNSFLMPDIAESKSIRFFSGDSSSEIGLLDFCCTVTHQPHYIM